MRYGVPFPMEIFDFFVKEHSLSLGRRYIFEKLAQLDSSILREFSFSQLGRLYKINRQTISTSINYFCNQKLLLSTSKGLIMSIPTSTGFIGVFVSEYGGIYRFMYSIPNTRIIYSVEIFQDDIEEPVLNKLEIGRCYYLVAKIKSDQIPHSPNMPNDETYITFGGNTLTDCYLLEEIGFRYHDNQLLSLNEALRVYEQGQGINWNNNFN